MRLLIIFMFFTLAGYGQPQDSLYLWPGQAPGEEEAKHSSERKSEGGVLRFTNVTHPSLAIFKPEASVNNGRGIIICPGGGYRILAMDLEGYEIARWLNELGYTAFVLQYRVPDKREGAFKDIQRALRVVQSKSDQWHLDSNKIGVLGFSAGGHLCARAATQSPRPDFALLIYPAYLDKGPARSLSPELAIDSNTPPMFIFGTADDKYGNSSLVMAQALRDRNVPVELHMMPEGGHGYGLRDGNPAAEIWPALAAKWLKHLIKASPPDMHNSRNALDWPGVYKGVLPCADCEGIRIELRLKQDQTYEMATCYLGKSEEVFQISGSFEWNQQGSRIKLKDLSEHPGHQHYQVSENKLFMLDRQGNRIRGDLASKYILRKVVEKVE